MSLQPGTRPDANAAVQVGRLQQRFVCADAAQAARLSGQWDELRAAWHDSLQGVDDAMLTAVPDDPEEWVLIPRLQVHARWRPEAPTPQWGQDWWQAVGRAVDDCVQSPQAHAVLRYRRRSVALADLLYRSAVGDTSRQWAWHCMGLIDRAALSPEEALRQGWSQLCGHPADLGPVLQSLLRAERETGAWSAIVRRLAAADWRALRAALPAAWAGAAAHASVRDAGDASVALTEPEPEPMAQGAQAPLVQAWRAWVRRQPVLVARWAASADAGDTLAALLGAWCWPWASTSEVQARWAGWRAQVFQGAADAPVSGRHAVRRAMPDARPATPSREPAAWSAQAESNQGDAHTLAHENAMHEGPARSNEPPRHEADEFTVPELPQQADARQHLATAWAGACFWLGRLPRVWPVLCAELASRLSLRADSAHPLLIQAEAGLGAALAEALGVPLSDPVSRLWRGGFGVVNEADKVEPNALSPEVADALRHTARQQVQDWSERLWAELGANVPGADAHGAGPHDLATPAAAMAWLVQRPASLRIEPGWVELCFAHELVDTRIRRLALDLDPGWVPLCQAVVRFRYD